MNWTSAEQHCIDRFKSHLVSIHNDDEFNEIKQEIISLGKEYENFWIGLRNINNGNNINDYYWSDGTLFNFGIDINGGIYPWQNYSNAPNANIKYSKYIRLWGINNLLWDDVEGDTKLYWICNDNTNNSILSIISFNYIELDNDTLIDDIIDNILQNMNISICINSYEFNINIRENNQFKTAVINIFIEICNIGIEMIEITEIGIKNKLENDFIYLINNNITSNIIEIDKESLDILVSITRNSNDLYSYSTTNVIKIDNQFIFSHNVRIFPFEIYLFLSVIIICCICTFSCLLILFINKHEMSIQNKTHSIENQRKPSKINCKMDQIPAVSPILSIKDSEQMLTVSQSIDHSITFPVNVEKAADIKGDDTDLTDDLFDILSPNTTPSGHHRYNNNHNHHNNNNPELSPFQINNKLLGIVDVILERHEDDSVEELFEPTVNITSPGNDDENHLKVQTMGSDEEFVLYRDKTSVEGISSDTQNDHILSAQL